MYAQEKYYKELTKLLDKAFHAQADKVEEAAQIIAKSALNGGMVYTFGTGHGHLLSLEIFYRAGGMVKVCPILDDKLMLHISASESTLWERKEDMADALLEKYPVEAGDVLIAFSNSGRNTVPVELAVKCRERGAKVIALTSMNHTSQVTPRNKLGMRLFEAADLVLDNMGVLGDAVIEGTGGRMVGPTSTAIGAALLQSIVCRVEEIAREQNKPIDYFASSNIDGGDEINNRYIALYKDQIPGL